MFFGIIFAFVLSVSAAIYGNVHFYFTLEPTFDKYNLSLFIKL